MHVTPAADIIAQDRPASPSASLAEPFDEFEDQLSAARGLGLGLVLGLGFLAGLGVVAWLVF